MTHQKEDEQLVCKTNEDVALRNFYKSNIIQPLKGFCATVEEGCSISKAARKLFISPSAISKQIASLEDKLKVKLFYHKKENLIERVALELTEDGKEFYERAKEIIEKTDGLVMEYLEEKDERESRTLRISTTSAIISKFMPHVIAYKKKNPNIKIIFESHPQEVALSLLSNNKIDIFISTIEENEKIQNSLKFIKLVDYAPYWVLYKGHPLENKSPNEISKSDIIKSDLVFNKKGLTSTSLKNFTEVNNIKSVINLDELGIEDLKSLIKSKVGMWVIFDIFLNKEDEKDFLFKKATNIFLNGQCGCLVNKNYNQKNIIKNFIELLVSKKYEIFDLNFLKE